ncbi:hypothetical protein B9479_000117 [Cryptococcus floricola]|uniref:ATP-dependent DNA ligase family profile domain-containing protein n=1 Tax=Cryptococcus floricola TaxID=2591691 RepID=A0A5D3B7Y4_9TREE|nr:hypothetical protein B9479_000117 [Cryptococcus floricola]
MAPKRQDPASPAYPAKKAKGSSGNQQKTLASFFASPSKAKSSKPNDSEVITIDDSDDEERPIPATTKLAAVGEKSRKQATSTLGSEGARSVSDKISPQVNKPIDILDDEDEDIKPVPECSKSTHPSKGKASISTQKKDAFSKTPVIASAAGNSDQPLDFDTDSFVFIPSSIDTSLWPKGRLPYSILVGVYVQVSGTRSRLAIVRILTNFLHLVMHASPVDLSPSLYLLSNHLAPSYVPCDLGIGSQILSKAMQDVSGLQPRDLKRLYQKYGDPGDVAFEAKTNLRTLVKPAPLLAADVYEKLIGLSKIKGSSSGKVKGDIVRKLMVQARGEEVRFLVRSMIGNLRIGAVKLTLLTALARATALLHLPKDLRSTILPLPVPTVDGKGKRSTKVKPETDPSREAAEQLCLSAIGVVRKAYVRHPNYAHLIKGLELGVEGLEERVAVTVGIPLSPMLGSITRSLNEVYTRLGKLPFTAEAKLDGQRVQCHVRLEGPQGEDDGGGRWVVGDTGDKIWVRLFSRHLDDMTEKYPDVCQLLLRLLKRTLPVERLPFPSSTLTEPQSVLDLLKTEKITSFIIDAEIVAIDKDTGAFKTFQELSNRAKKDVREEDIKVIVGVYAFDLMVLNDIPLLGSPFSHRRHLMRTFLPPLTPTKDSPPSSLIAARFNHVESVDSTKFEDAPAELQAFFEKVVENKCEGLMVKLLESGEGLEGEDAEAEEEGETEVKRKSGNRKPLPATYEPDQRSQGWLKVKKDYLEGLGDSLDLVPIGAWWGSGRKAGWWSPILLACHNPESGALEAVCKCMSGFSDAFYKDLTKRYPAEGMPEKCNKTTPLGYIDTNGLTPDVWFDPSEVWEIRGADITLSPVYPAASSALGSERGLSVRFPRFMKIREDKTWEEATTSEQFADMYRKQMETKPEAAEGAGEEDEDV